MYYLHTNIYTCIIYYLQKNIYTALSIIYAAAHFPLRNVPLDPGYK